MSETRPIQELRDHPQAALVPFMTSGEYRSFLADVSERGIVDPIQITSQRVVLDGRHRLRAARDLGFAAVPVRVVEPVDEVSYMLLAAFSRRQLTASQKAALVVELEQHRLTRAKALKRRRANLRQNTEVATLPPRSERSREIAANIAGVSPRTIQDAETVRIHDPELFEQIKHGQVPAHAAARRVRRAQRDLAFATPPLPNGTFNLIYADPPWQLGNPTSAYAPENHYPTMALEEIKDLEVPAVDDAVLFLWAVASKLPEALQAMEAWSFEYKTCLTWVKDWIGLGTWVRHRHELLLLGRRGNYPPPEPEDRPDSVFEAPRGRHSAKPACVYELIERAYPHASKLELFARGVPRAGWSAWGNEVEAA
jgi:N6-adenosine-specific RNA methylase IME4